MGTTRMRTAAPLLVAAVLAAAPLATSAAGSTAPTLAELRGATYHGFEEAGTVTLANGRWEGAPYEPGGASRPSLRLSERFLLVGDVDGDGTDEAVVHLVWSGGGTGSIGHLAVMARSGKAVVQKAIGPLGDRVQVRDARIESGTLRLDVLQAGPGDAMCCPSQLATRRFRLRSGALAEDPAEVTGAASLASLGGQTWTLARPKGREREPAGAPITLTFRDGRVEGFAGCNRYTGSTRQGSIATDFAVEGLASTRMACPPPLSEREQRFLDALGKARSWRFELGALIVHWGAGTQSGQLDFSRQAPAQ